MASADPFSYQEWGHFERISMKGNAGGGGAQPSVQGQEMQGDEASGQAGSQILIDSCGLHVFHLSSWLTMGNGVLASSGQGQCGGT